MKALHAIFSILLLLIITPTIFGITYCNEFKVGFIFGFKAEMIVIITAIIMIIIKNDKVLK